MDLRCSRIRCWWRYIDLRGRKWRETGENNTLRSFITCILVLFTNYYSGDNLKRYEMGKSCGTYGEKKMRRGFWRGNLKGKRPLGRFRHSWEETYKFMLTLSWPAGHILPTYKESFQVRWGNSIPLFLYAPIYLEVYLFRWTSQNAFSRETAVCKWYCVHSSIAHSIICTRENAFWLVQRNRYTSR
jgi:hypothetical protein